MNLSGNCCRCIGILVMLIGITTGSSVVQAGSEGTSSASRGPSGDAGAKKWSSPSKAAPVNPTSANPIAVSPADAAKLGEIVKKVEAELVKSGEAAASQPSVQSLIDIIRGTFGGLNGML
jgi:hypothetical protein